MNRSFPFRYLIASLSAFTIAACSYGYAQAENISDAQLAAAQKAITAVHATDQFDQFLPKTARDLKNELTRKDPNFAQVISDTVDQQALLLAKRRGDLEREAARVYAKNFTEDDLNKISSFYNSDAGKKLLKQGPVAMGDIVQAFQIWRQGIAQDLAANVGKALNEKLGGRSAVTPKEAISSQPAKTPAPQH